MQIEQIERCPFCDCSWVVIHRPINGAHVSVKCKGCNAHGPGHAGITDEEAVAAWNKIPRLASLSARPAVGEDVVERIVDAALDAANLVSHDGYYEIDRDAATRAAIAAITGDDHG